MYLRLMYCVGTTANATGTACTFQTTDQKSSLPKSWPASDHVLSFGSVCLRHQRNPSARKLVERPALLRGRPGWKDSVHLPLPRHPSSTAKIHLVLGTLAKPRAEPGTSIMSEACSERDVDEMLTNVAYHASAPRGHDPFLGRNLAMLRDRHGTTIAPALQESNLPSRPNQASQPRRVSSGWERA